MGQWFARDLVNVIGQKRLRGSRARRVGPQEDALWTAIDVKVKLVGQRGEVVIVVIMAVDFNDWTIGRTLSGLSKSEPAGSSSTITYMNRGGRARNCLVRSQQATPVNPPNHNYISCGLIVAETYKWLATTRMKGDYSIGTSPLAIVLGLGLVLNRPAAHYFKTHSSFAARRCSTSGRSAALVSHRPMFRALNQHRHKRARKKRQTASNQTFQGETGERRPKLSRRSVPWSLLTCPAFLSPRVLPSAPCVRPDSMHASERKVAKTGGGIRRILHTMAQNRAPAAALCVVLRSPCRAGAPRHPCATERVCTEVGNLMA
jgi:hypothetical protein